MLLVVFGAGASYDSASDFPASEMAAIQERPPLANDLFQHRRKFTEALRDFGELIPLAARLRPRDDDSYSLEDELGRLQAEAEDDPHRKTQLMAIRFYLQRIIRESADDWWKTIGGINNYAALLEMFRHAIETGQLDKPVGLVTFNYDTLLDRAITAQTGNDFPTFDEYVSPHNSFKLFKLHGSTDWWRAVSYNEPRGRPTVGAARFLINNASALKFMEDRFEIQREIRRDRVTGFDEYHAIPALAIPVARGKGFECPDKHLDVLKGLLPSTTHLLTIGWRGMEEPFLEMLSKATQIKHSLVVSGSGATSTVTHLSQKVSGTISQPDEHGFTRFCRQYGELEEFLGRSP